MDAKKVQTIPILSAIDKNYVPIYSVFLASALEHININFNYEFILLTDNVPDNMLYMLQMQTNRLDNVSLSIVDMTNFLMSKTNNFITFPKSACYRLYVPELFTQYDKIIYLDPDIIVLGDLSKLLHTLTNEYAAAVLDYGMNGLVNTNNVCSKWAENYCNAETYYLEYCGFDRKTLKKYFNSGMLVLNLDKMRKNKIVSRSLELLYSKNFTYPDQDILNFLFNGDVNILSQEWNFIPYENINLKFSNDLIEQRKNAISHIKILHFAGSKPWKNTVSVKFEEFFWYYSRKSLYYEQLLKNKKTKENNISIFVFNLLKYNLFSNLLRRYCPYFYELLKKIYYKIIKNHTKK